MHLCQAASLFGEVLQLLLANFITLSLCKFEAVENLQALENPRRMLLNVLSALICQKFVRVSDWQVAVSGRTLKSTLNTCHLKQTRRR